MPIAFCLFVCFFCVCTVTYFSAEDKASGVKFCPVVHRRSGQEISYLAKLCSPEAHPEAQNRTNRLRRPRWAVIAQATRACARATRRMCGYTAVPEDGRTY